MLVSNSQVMDRRQTIVIYRIGKAGARLSFPMILFLPFQGFFVSIKMMIGGLFDAPGMLWNDSGRHSICEASGMVVLSLYVHINHLTPLSWNLNLVILAMDIMMVVFTF